MRTSRASDRGALRAPLAALLVLLVLLAAGLVGLSPLALGIFRGEAGYWERLSFIGQTYGAASALLSVVAIVGVVATLVFQAREVRVAREEARRTAVSDLLKMAMDDPDFNECWGPTGLDEPFRDQRQHMYINLVVSEWQMSFETGALGEKRLRAIAAEMFRGRPGRRYWQEAREIRLATTENKKAHRFHQVLDEAYREVKHLPVPDTTGGNSKRAPVPLPREHRGIHPVLWMALGAAATAIARRTWSLRRTQPRQPASARAQDSGSAGHS